MKLQQCSINGKKYTITNYGIQEENCSNVTKLREFDYDISQFFLALSVCHTVQVGSGGAGNEVNDSNVERTFEIIESSSSTIDMEEEVVTKVETRNNTKQNEIAVPENLLNNLPIGGECKSLFSLFSIYEKNKFAKKKSIRLQHPNVVH